MKIFRTSDFKVKKKLNNYISNTIVNDQTIILINVLEFALRNFNGDINIASKYKN